VSINQRIITMNTYGLTIVCNLIGIATLATWRPDWDWGYAFRAMMREAKRREGAA